MFRLKELESLGSKAELAALPEGKLLINTINAHSYNTARKDKLFAEALTNGDVLIPDGVSIVKACKWIKAKSQPKERIAGWDLFSFEMGKEAGRGRPPGVFIVCRLIRGQIPESRPRSGRILYLQPERTRH